MLAGKIREPGIGSCASSDTMYIGKRHE